MLLVLAGCGPVEEQRDGALADRAAMPDAPAVETGGDRDAEVPFDGTVIASDSSTPPEDAAISPMDVIAQDRVVPPRDATAEAGAVDAGPAGRIPTTTPPPGIPAMRTQAEVCGVWNTSYNAARMAGTFTAGSPACAPGRLPQNAVDAAVLMSNVHRWLAGLTNVSENPEFSRSAQACAELQEANNMLSHTPPMSWTCYTALGAQGAGRSNITSGGSTPIAAIAGWIDDTRDISMTLGHRRWILFPPLGPIGYGQARRYACQYVLGPRATGSKTFVAWPNEGFTPTESMTPLWSFSSSTLGLTASTRVTVTRNGMPVAATAQLRAAGYGEPTISWNMPATAITAGSVISVTVTGLAGGMSTTYEVRPVRCGG